LPLFDRFNPDILHREVIERINQHCIVWDTGNNLHNLRNTREWH
jgi:hypothetical protein